MTVEKLISEKAEVEIIGVTLLSDDEGDEYGKYIPNHRGFPWWLRSPLGAYPHFNADYSRFFTFSDFDYTGGIRPALLIKTEMAPGIKFVLNQNVFTVLSSELALCDSIVGVFNCLWLPEDDFDYETVTDEEYEKMVERT